MEVLQEGQEFLMAMPRLVLSDHFSSGHIRCCEQCRSAMSEVVMCDTFNMIQRSR